MLVEPVTESSNSMSLSGPATTPANQETATKDNKAEKSVQTTNLAELSKIVADVQKNMNIIHNVDLHFSVNKDSNRIIVTVTDEATGKVIREIPSSELVKFADKFGEMVGMIFDQKG
jgi:flagellar protein FlaG